VTTYRERRAAKAERLREWAGKREAKSEAAYEASHSATAGIPFGQPILVGHHSEGRHRRAIERSDNAMRRAVENSQKAESMRARADGIEAAADRAIYSDDPDAIERLAEQIETETARRDAMKAKNAEFRKAAGAEFRALTFYEKDQTLPFASFTVKNLTANIGRKRKRLAGLKAKAGQ